MRCILPEDGHPVSKPEVLISAQVFQSGGNFLATSPSNEAYINFILCYFSDKPRSTIEVSGLLPPREGQKLSLSCTADAYPLPEANNYTWWTHGKLLAENHTNTLFIDVLEPTEHDGLYMCMANNIAGYGNMAQYNLAMLCKYVSRVHSYIY